MAHDAQALVANSSKGVGGRRLSKKRAHGGETGAGGGGGGAAATSALVGILEGGADILRNVSTVDQARQFFSRSAVTLAMGQVRQRILTEGLWASSRMRVRVRPAWEIGASIKGRGALALRMWRAARRRQRISRWLLMRTGRQVERHDKFSA